jgi:hypothetical protein
MTKIIDGSVAFNAAIRAMPDLHIVIFHDMPPSVHARKIENTGDIPHRVGCAYPLPLIERP